MSDAKSIPVSLTVSLSGEQFAALSEDVEAGGYASTDELVHDALWEWRLNHNLNSRQVERLRQLWDEGIASGPAQPFDLEQGLYQARARLESARAARER